MISIPVNRPLFIGNEKKYLSECIETGWISSEGPFVERLEREFAGVCGRRFGIAVTSGSAALEVAVKALGIGKGDEVIVPSFTIIACLAAIVRSGAIPVLVDSELDTWNMSVESISIKISSKTRAIMAVHTYGLSVDMDPLLDIARKWKLHVIEDASQMHGQTYKGRACGSFGDISTFSFYANKTITTGEGGIILTDNEDIALKCKRLRDHCFIPERRFFHEDLGWNFRLTNLQAAVGVAQLEMLPLFVQRKRAIGRAYNELLRENTALQLPCINNNTSANIYWIYGFLLNETAKLTAEQLGEHLKNKGIGTRPFFYPMHLQPVFRRMGLFHGDNYPVAERLASCGLYVPSGLGTTDDEIYEVGEAINNALNH